MAVFKTIVTGLNLTNTASIINPITPTANNELAAISTVTNQIQAETVNLNWKKSVFLVVDNNISLINPGNTFDGIQISGHTELLLIGQTDLSENGVYIWTASDAALIRRSDLTTKDAFINCYIPVENGNKYKGLVFFSFDVITTGGIIPKNYYTFYDYFQYKYNQNDLYKTFKNAANTASFSTIDLNNCPSIINGVNMQNGYSALILGMSKQNGKYIYNNAVLTRSLDNNDVLKVRGSIIPILGGTYKDHIFQQSNEIEQVGSGSGSDSVIDFRLIYAPTKEINFGDGINAEFQIYHYLNTRDLSIDVYENNEIVDAKVILTDLNYFTIYTVAIPTLNQYKVKISVK